MKLYRAHIVPLVASLSLVFASPSAAEDLWEFTFTGHVITATPGLPAPWSAVNLGDPCTARYLLDLDAPDLIPLDPDVGSYNALGFSAAIGSVEVAGDASRIDLIRNHASPHPADTYYTYFLLPGPDIIGVFLDDTVFSGLPDALPDDQLSSMLNFSAFNTGRFFQVGFNGTQFDPPREVLVSLETFSAQQVPAPSTAMLAAAGLIASARRRFC